MFGVTSPPEVQGLSLLPLLQDPHVRPRDAALYGMHGCAVNITDGRYTYFHYPPQMPGTDLYNYTLMPTHMDSRFSIAELSGAELANPFSFTRGLRTLKVPCDEKSPIHFFTLPEVQIDCQSRLYDLQNDPLQQRAIESPRIVKRLKERIVELMQLTDAPAESYLRFALEPAKRNE
jgi:hypothetical protein